MFKINLYGPTCSKRSESAAEESAVTELAASQEQQLKEDKLLESLSERQHAVVCGVLFLAHQHAVGAFTLPQSVAFLKQKGLSPPELRVALQCFESKPPMSGGEDPESARADVPLVDCTDLLNCCTQLPPSNTMVTSERLSTSEVSPKDQ